MFKSFFENVMSCKVNIESVNIAEECIFYQHIVHVKCKNVNSQMHTQYSVIWVHTY